MQQLVDEARQVTELRYTGSGDEGVEARLIKTYGLADAVVVEAGTEEQETAFVAEAAANYMVANVRSGARVALSCGETLLRMMMALPKRQHVRLEITQLCLEGDPIAVHHSPLTLIGLLRAKSAPTSDAYALQLIPPDVNPVYAKQRELLISSEVVKRLRARCLAADFVFVGVGTPLPASGESHSFSRLALTAMPEPDYRAAVAEYGIVGELNNQLYDAQGRSRTNDIAPLASRFVNVLGLHDLQSMASQPDRHRVVAVATGQQKVEALRVALRRGLVNTLITSRDSAMQILAGARPVAPQRRASTRRTAASASA